MSDLSDVRPEPNEVLFRGPSIDYPEEWQAGLVQHNWPMPMEIIPLFNTCFIGLHHSSNRTKTVRIYKSTCTKCITIDQ